MNDSGSTGVPGTWRDARVEVRLVREHGLAMAHGPAGDPLALGEADGRAHDLVGVLVADDEAPA